MSKLTPEETDEFNKLVEFYSPEINKHITLIELKMWGKFQLII